MNVSYIWCLMKAIRVVLADDNKAFLGDIASKLRGQCEVVGTAKRRRSDHHCEFLEAGLLVLDISMPLLNGLEVAARLQGSGCLTKIIFLTIHEQQTYISAAFSAGGSAYVTKRHVSSDLASAVRTVVEGGKFLSPSLQEYTRPSS